MLKIEEKNIYCNRGDAISIIVHNNLDFFKINDYLTFYICSSGDYTDVKLSKRVDVTENSDEVVIALSSEDTRFDSELKNGEKEYWYEIELNGDTTLVGYDKKGPKIFTLWPEVIDEGGNS